MCRRRVAVLPLATSPQAHLRLGLADDRADTLQIVGQEPLTEEELRAVDAAIGMER